MQLLLDACFRTLKKGVVTPSVRASGGELPSASSAKCKNIPSYAVVAIPCSDTEFLGRVCGILSAA
jgi:hypothetical protein